MSLLSVLLDEAYAYLHRALCASALRRKLLTLPFRRDVEVTPQSTAAMHAALTRAMQVGNAPASAYGLVCVSMVVVGMGGSICL